MTPDHRVAAWNGKRVPHGDAVTTEHSSSLARLIRENQPCVALTGARVSTDKCHSSPIAPDSYWAVTQTAPAPTAAPPMLRLSWMVAATRPVALSILVTEWSPQLATQTDVGPTAIASGR